MPLIVTGGAGFIGSHLVNLLFSTGHEITVVDRIVRPESIPVSRKIAYRKIDAYRINRLGRRGFRNAGIVHLAAETSVRQSVRDPFSTVKSNIGVTCAVLDFARRLDSQRFVFASTAAVYGDRRGPCKESDFPLPTSPYAASKLACEHYCKVYSELYGIPTVILRYFNVYGPGQSNHYSGVIKQFAEQALHGQSPLIFGDGSQTRDFVFIDDVVTATVTALQRPIHAGTIVNIGSGKSISIASLADRVLRILKIKHLRPIHTSARPGDVRHSEADIALSRRTINFRPSHDLNAGLRATVEWLRT